MKIIHCWNSKQIFAYHHPEKDHFNLHLDSQIVYHNPCFDLILLRNNSFDNQASKINKNDIFVRFDFQLFPHFHFIVKPSN